MVKRLTSYVLIVVLYALGLASIQALVASPADRPVYGTVSRLDEGSEQARDDHSRSRQVEFRARAAKDRMAATPQTLDEFRQEIGKKNCLVFLTASWCVPCRRMHKIVDELGDYYVYEIDIDAEPKVAAGLKVSSVPTMIVFEDGKELARYVGITSKATLTAKLKTKADQVMPEPDYNFR